MNLFSGFYDFRPTETASDILLRHNYCRNVGQGVNYQREWPVGRMIMHDNIIEVGTGFVTPPPIEESPTGISLRVANATRYSAVILRKNIFRHVLWDSAPATIAGIHAANATDINIQFNVINNSVAGSNIVLVGATNPYVQDNLDTSGNPQNQKQHRKSSN